MRGQGDFITQFMNLAQAIRVYTMTCWGLKWPLITKIFFFPLRIPKFVLLPVS